MWLDALNQMKKISKKTTEQISLEAGIPKGTLNKIFAGQTKDPQYTTLKAIVNCLGFTIDDLENEKALESKKDPREPVTKSELSDVLEALGVIKDGYNLTEADAKFLCSVISMIKKWFER